MKFGLKTEIVEEIEKILAGFPQVKTVIIYGSRAKGNYRQGSDIDLTFKGNDLNLRILNQISLQIDHLLLPYTFDLSVFEQIDNTDLVNHIERVGKVFYQKELGKIIS
jgi:uncharacterized protein